MTPLTPEQREYKEKTLAQLQLNLPLLETNVEQESRPEVVNSLQKQIDDIQAHIDLLQHELAANTAGEPVADALFQRAAGALTNKKFFLAKKLINKLEAIEPFYPDIERLRQEAEARRASRRTRAVVQRGTPPPQTGQRLPTSQETTAQSTGEAHQTPGIYPAIPGEEEKKGFSRFFQFHIIISCLVVLLILCIMSGIGGVMLLQWLIEGG